MASIQGGISASKTFSEPGRLYALTGHLHCIRAGATGRLHYIRVNATGHLHYIHAGATGCLCAWQTTSRLSGH